MKRDIFVDGVACQVPDPVYRFLNDVLAAIDGERGRPQTVFGYDDKLRPYRTGVAPEKVEDIESLLNGLESRFDSLLLSLRGKSEAAVKPRRKSKRSTVVGRVEGRPIYKEVVDLIPSGADRKQLIQVLEGSGYSRNSAGILASSYQKFLQGRGVGGLGRPNQARAKGKFAHLTEIDKIGGIKIYAEVLDAIRERGGADLDRSSILDILIEYGFSPSSAQVRVRYYIERI